MADSGIDVSEPLQQALASPTAILILLPGLAVDLALEPITGWLRAVIDMPAPSSLWKIVPPIVVAIAAGLIVSALNDFTYKVYEARTLWPKWLKRRLIQRLKANVDTLEAKRQRIRRTNPDQYDELSLLLRDYPVKLGEDNHVVQSPTLMGNIIAEYELYPKTRYGVDSIFFWPRLWLLVEKDEKERISRTWSTADGLVSLSAVGFLAGLGWILYAIVDAIWIGYSAIFAHGGSVWSPKAWQALIFSLFGLVLGYAFYRVSLLYHRRNGEVFKSLFDLYHRKVFDALTAPAGDETWWRTTWAHLQYLRVRCLHCHAFIRKGMTSCPHCNSDPTKP
jgi:hypothetical protein